MKTAALLTAAALLLYAPLAAAGDTIATGHIDFGTPTTALITTAEATDEDGPEAFLFDAPAAGTVITTITTDNSGLGYDLDFYFFDADGNFVDGCYTEASDEICTVPEGATQGEVAAFLGADLDVTVATV